MTISARIIEDSISPAGARLTTFELRYPRVIHAEFMTHRLFSRNASSSRAIPWKRMRQWILDDPYIPLSWGKNQKGMQATEELSTEDQMAARELWLRAAGSAIRRADELMALGIHKQLINRLVEPFGHINVVCTATNFTNFFALRIHKAAMPEIQCLAVRMARAYAASQPVERWPGGLHSGSWHLPYILEEDRATFSMEDLIKMSVARCARVSYRTHEGKLPTAEEDFALHDQLVGSDPKHASPAEHQAHAFNSSRATSGNLRGWCQYRKTLEGECAMSDLPWLSRLVEYEGRDYII